MTNDRAHPTCWRGDHYEHTCQRPSGNKCYEHGCENDAGTAWGPYYCVDHDVARIDKISAGMAEIMKAMKKWR